MVNWQKRNSVDVRPTDVGWKDKRSICPGQRCACNSPLQPPCVGQRSPTVQMTPSLFQLQNFHTPFPISSLPGDRPPSVFRLCSMSKAGECHTRPSTSSPQCVSQDTAQTKPAHPLLSKSVLPERVLSEPVLSDHIMCGGLLRPTMFCLHMFCQPRGFISLTTSTSCQRQQKSYKAVYSCTFILRGCFLAFIFGLRAGGLSCGPASDRRDALELWLHYPGTQPNPTP